MFISPEIQHQTLAVLPILFNEISMGFAYGWVAPALRGQTELSLNNEQRSWIGSLHEFGRFFGPLIAFIMVDKCGRKMVLTICTITFFTIWPFIFFTRSVAIVYAVRFAFGFAVGLNDVCSSIYLGENCSPKLRSIFGSVSIACFYGGELVEFAIATYLPYSTVAIINAICTFLQLSCILVAKETPQFFITKKNYEKGEKNFNYLQGKVDNAGNFEKLKKFVEEENSEKVGFSKIFTNRIYYNPTLLIITLSIFMMMTGFAAVTSFVSIAFSESETLTPNQFTTLFGLCQFTIVCMSPFLIEKFPRRNILMVSFALIALVHFITSVLYYASSHNIYIPFLEWLKFSFITLYAMIFSFGLHPIFYTVRGEIFPQRIKAIGGSIAILAHSAMGFLSSKMFLIIGEMYGIYLNFLVYAIFSLFAVLFVYLWIPETRGKTLEEIQEAMRSKQKASKTKPLY